MPNKKSDETSRKVTASDVAARAGVSKWTVSRAFTAGASISEDARERVLQIATELGYRPNLLARSLTTRRSGIVGLVVDELANPNLAPVLDEVTGQLQRRGYLAMLLNISSDQGRDTLSLADQFQVDGLIFLGTVLTGELVEFAQDSHHIPLIVLYRNSDIPHIQVVSTDGYAAGRQIAALLAEQGSVRIGYMAGPTSLSTQLKRLDGFRDGLAERGLGVEVVLDADHYRRDCGFRAMSEYLYSTAAADRVEAMFCENDILAVGALEALKTRRCTGTVGIVGFDDIELASSPNYELTTYRQPMARLVDEAMRRLTDGNCVPRTFLALGELVIRRSHVRHR
ncbi:MULTISPECIES: LacI family DNA-binding transcriptional regulator [unclassified Burkholderia]|uniref:LacI family DNA-binding transcriptional regulator n=1 Tax=unclassified Burkholderia TaxID=2613784 RepID=UPI002AB2218F|nr:MULTISPECIES: LacI family DNA-binding transcriptional regulator [unclassified Burkholderia]